MEIIATGITGPQIPARVTGLDNFVFSAQAVPPIPDPRTLALAVVFLDSPNWVSPVRTSRHPEAPEYGRQAAVAPVIGEKPNPNSP
jgi:hypothetical protein